MEHTFRPLESHPLPPKITFQQPVQPKPRRVTLEDAATEVMTDFRRVRAITVPATVTMEYAYERMRANRVHLLLVTDEQNAILGLITSTDIEGEKPYIEMAVLGVRGAQLSVADIMTPRERIAVIKMEDVERACVGNVVATLKAVERQHAMVIALNGQGVPIVRGLFAVS